MRHEGNLERRKKEGLVKIRNGGTTGMEEWMDGRKEEGRTEGRKGRLIGKKVKELEKILR